MKRLGLERCACGHRRNEHSPAGSRCHAPRYAPQRPLIRGTSYVCCSCKAFEQERPVDGAGDVRCRAAAGLGNECRNAKARAVVTVLEPAQHGPERPQAPGDRAT